MFCVWFWKKKTCPKSRFSRFLRKIWRKFTSWSRSQVILISLSLLEKEWKQKSFTLQIPSESQNFSAFSSRIKVKSFLEPFNPLWLGPAYRQHLRAGYSLFVGRWRLCSMSRVCNCLMRQVHQSDPHRSWTLYTDVQLSCYFSHLVSQIFPLFYFPGDLDLFEMRQSFIFQGKLVFWFVGWWSILHFTW